MAKITTTFTGPWLILGEGKGDKYFFDALIKDRGITGFQVEFPAFATGDTGGIGRMAEYLALLGASETRKNLEAIILVADNDTSPDTSFRTVQKLIRQANKRMARYTTSAAPYRVPTAPLEAACGADAPALVVMMLPWTGEPGALETLCLQAVYGKWRNTWPNMEGDLDLYVNASPSRTWGITGQSKTRMQCCIAATCKPDPNSGLPHLFERSKHKSYRFSLRHRSFNRVFRFLRDFNDFIEAARGNP